MYKLKSISRRAIIASLALFGLFAIYGSDDDIFENISMRNLEEKKPLGVCHNWCIPHTDPWDMKCTFKYCTGCSKCFEQQENVDKSVENDKENEEVSTAKYCDGWCLPHSDPWDMKCTFKRCNGCSQCSEQESQEDTLSSSKSTNSGPNSTEEQQEEVDHENPPGECQSWCLPHPDPWDMKCTFKHCNGCSKCFEQQEKPADLSSADQTRFVAWGDDLEKYLMTHM